MPSLAPTRTVAAVEAFQRALEERAKDKPKFNGTVSSASKLMDGVGHQQLRNLVRGNVRPWKLTVHTKNEILRIFKRYGITEADFAQPRDL